MNDAIKLKLKELPLDSGVYMMRDISGAIIYVGKAKNLKNRVRSYFNASPKAEKVLSMVQKVADFDYLITRSEEEALVLENNLIKLHKPFYNILLKDDKLYPFLRIDTSKPFPKVEVIRRLKADKARYFGPYMVGISAAEMLRLIHSAFPIRDCSLNMDKIPKNHRPCLNAHIGRCLAPCSGAVSREEYHRVLQDVISFLKGNDNTIKENLERKMQEASEAMQYEQALRYRNALSTLDKMIRRQIAALPKDFNLDIFGLASGGDGMAVATVIVRGGKMVGGEKFAIRDGSIDLAGTLSSFINRYYDGGIVADEVVSAIELPDAAALSELLSEKKGEKVAVSTPKAGVRKQLADIAMKNAMEYLSRSTAELSRKERLTTGACRQLADLLSLSSTLDRIECFDISHTSGTDKVSSMVVFTKGEKDAKMYRTFHIKTVEGNNDFACMKETLDRRFARLKEGKDASFGTRPDLLVIDGGIGQVHYAMQSMKEAGESIPMIGLAEREEIIVLPSGEEIILPKSSFALRLLIRIRDEAHRFAITFHRKLRGKRSVKSMLLDIEGMGEKRVAALHKAFGSLDELRNATAEEIASVKGIPAPLAEKVVAFFKENAK
ncbi:MAG TPA: excinuclease ABC subunit C [Clostridiales bacterium]|nr:excinuclease ABC subunit C [Clostridiales bacterium]